MSPSFILYRRNLIQISTLLQVVTEDIREKRRGK